MKIPRFVPLVALLSVSACTLLIAQDALQVAVAKPAKSEQRKDGKRGGQKRDRMAMMTERLGLSAAQKARIKPIMESANRQAQAVRADTSLSRDQKRAKMRQIRANSWKKISPILTAAQRQKIAQMRKEHGARRNGGAHKNGKTKM